jgi:hypothetical protein
MFIQMLACNVFMMLSMGSSDFVINLPDVGLGVIMGFSNLQIAPTIWLFQIEFF